MEKRSFSKEEKLAIIKEASINGVTSTLEKHGIYPASFYSWKKKFESMGEEGFSHGMTPQFLKRIRELEKENLALKQIVAEKELENKLKGELLKKKQALEKRKRSQPGTSTKA
jgi:putative transposase